MIELDGRSLVNDMAWLLKWAGPSLLVGVAVDVKKNGVSGAFKLLLYSSEEDCGKLQPKTSSGMSWGGGGVVVEVRSCSSEQTHS